MSLHRQLPGFRVAPASWEDVPHIVTLRNASAQDTQGRDASAAHWQRRLWHESGIDLAADTRLVRAMDGRAVGYVAVTAEAPFVIHEVTAVVHPAFRGQGIGTALLQWAEARVCQQCHRAPSDTRVVVHQDPFLENRPARDLLAAAGYELVREFVFLRINMHQPPPPAQWPEGIVVRPLQPADWDKVGPALGEAFQDHWGIVDYEEEAADGKEVIAVDGGGVIAVDGGGAIAVDGGGAIAVDGGGAIPVDGGEDPAHNPQEPNPKVFNPDYFNTPGLCFVAWDGEEAVGSCLCNATTVAFPEAGYLGSLSIRPRYRRQGIGLALTEHALAAFYDRGTTAVVTDTDGASFTGANHLYEKAGMSVFTRTLVHEKEIRPGVDLVKRTMPID